MSNPFSTRRSAGVQIMRAAGVQQTYAVQVRFAVAGIINMTSSLANDFRVFRSSGNAAFVGALTNALNSQFGGGVTNVTWTEGAPVGPSAGQSESSQGLRLDFRVTTSAYFSVADAGWPITVKAARALSSACSATNAIVAGSRSIGDEPTASVRAVEGQAYAPTTQGPRVGHWKYMGGSVAVVGGTGSATPPASTPPASTPPGSTPSTYVAPPSSLTEAQLSTAQKTAIQQRLNELGYRGANGLALVADGNIGANTRAAISAFQRNNALSPVDGVAGRNTREKLALSTAVRATTTGGSTPPGSTPPGSTPPGSTPPGSTPPGSTPPGGTGTDALAGYRAAASELQTWIQSQPRSAIYDSSRRSIFNATLEGYQRRMNMGTASDGKYGPGTRSRMRELGVATPYEFPPTPGAAPPVEPPPQSMPPVTPIVASTTSTDTKGVPWWAWGIGLAIVGGAVVYAGMAGGGGGGGGGSREQYAALPRAEDRRIVVRPLRSNPRKSNKRRRR